MLYGLFQKFIKYDDVFRDTLWAEVDLGGANREVYVNPESSMLNIFKSNSPGEEKH